MKKRKEWRRFSEEQIAWIKRDELALIRGAVLAGDARYAPRILIRQLQNRTTAKEDKAKYLSRLDYEVLGEA